VRPYSAEYIVVEIRYSCKASGGTTVSGPLRRELLFSRPSRRKLDAEGRWPLADKPRLRAVAESSVTPG
jgi:hypothetical protein